MPDEGAGQEESEERPVIPLPTVFEIAAKIPARYRALVLLATFAQLRLGELAGLTRDRLDLDTCQVRITAALVQPDKGALRIEPPKSRAGKRSLTFPAEIRPDLQEHLDHYAEPGARGLVFVGPKGGKLRRQNFRPSGSPRAPLPGCRTRTSMTCATPEAPIPLIPARPPRSLRRDSATPARAPR